MPIDFPIDREAERLAAQFDWTAPDLAKDIRASSAPEAREPEQ